VWDSVVGCSVGPLAHDLRKSHRLWRYPFLGLTLARMAKVSYEGSTLKGFSGSNQNRTSSNDSQKTRRKTYSQNRRELSSGRLDV